MNGYSARKGYESATRTCISKSRRSCVYISSLLYPLSNPVIVADARSYTLASRLQASIRFTRLDSSDSSSRRCDAARSYPIHRVRPIRTATCKKGKKNNARGTCSYTARQCEQREREREKSSGALFPPLGAFRVRRSLLPLGQRCSLRFFMPRLQRQA